MPDIQTDLMKAMPSIVPSDVPAMSDDECLRSAGASASRITISTIWTRSRG